MFFGLIVIVALLNFAVYACSSFVLGDATLGKVVGGRHYVFYSSYRPRGAPISGRQHFYVEVSPRRWHIQYNYGVISWSAMGVAITGFVLFRVWMWLWWLDVPNARRFKR